MAAGAGIGGLAGGMAGKGVGGLVNPTEEDATGANYQTQPYYTPGYTYDDYAPAYALGYNGPPLSRQLRPERATTWPTSGTREGQFAPVVGPGQVGQPRGLAQGRARHSGRPDRDGR
jgi:hypothetical protein